MVAFNQIYPVRLATCNLHSINTKLGVSVLVPQINIKQFVLSIPISQQYIADNHIWLEAGGVSLGPVVVDAVMALPSPEFLSNQQHFLLLHDRKTHRLTFLWETESPTVCGCLGGCSFFGGNRNGASFFTPSDRDFLNATNAAVAHICDDGINYGYGQSLFRYNELVFALLGEPTGHVRAKISSSRQIRRGGSDEVVVSCDVTPTREPDIVTARRESDSVDQPPPSNVWNIPSKVPKPEVPRDFGIFPPRLSAVSEHDTEVGGVMLTPDEFLPVMLTPDVYHKFGTLSNVDGSCGITGSTNNIAEMAVTEQPKSKTPQSLRHERSSSYEQPKTFAALMPEKTSPTIAELRLQMGSRGSLLSSSGNSDVRSSLSRQSSFTSPVLRRLSSQMSVHREGAGSAASVVSGSDKFYSAAEDVGSSLSSIPRSFPKTHGRIPSSGSDKTQNGVLSSTPGSPVIAEHHLKSTYRDLIAENATDSDTESFVSAKSSQHRSTSDVHVGGVCIDDSSDEMTDDFEDLNGDESLDTDATLVPHTSNFVDLHGQINQQITKSPLLMTCYMNHMTQLQCSGWSAGLPHPVNRKSDVFASPDDSTSLSAGGGPSSQDPVQTWIPQFSYINEGFTPNIMVNRLTPKSPPSASSPSSASEWEARQKRFFTTDSKDLLHTDSSKLHNCVIVIVI